MARLPDFADPQEPSPPGLPAPARLVRFAAAFYGGLFLLALGWRTGIHGEPLYYASARAAAAGGRPLRDAALGIAVGIALVAASRIWTRRSVAGAELARALRALLGRLGPGAALLLAVLSGIGEEAFFRGALQPRVGWLVASLLFAAAHFVPRRELYAWAPAALFAGGVLGALFAWTGNLLAPALAHAVVNALNLRWLAGEPPPRLQTRLISPGSSPSISRSSSSRIK